MTTLDTHAFWFERAMSERASLLSRVNIPLGRRGRLLMVALALLVLPVAGFAAFPSSSSLDVVVTGSAVSGGAFSFIAIDDCRVSLGGAVDSCVIAGDGLSIDLALSGTDNDSVLILAVTIQNDGPDAACLQNTPPSTWGVVTDDGLDVFVSIPGSGGFRSIATLYAMDLVTSGLDLSQTLVYSFDTSSCV